MVMRKFFDSNIDRRGRIIRGVLGAVLVVAGLILSIMGRWICLLMVVAGAFMLYEAARGWCLMRACGVKTKY